MPLLALLDTPVEEEVYEPDPLPAGTRARYRAFVNINGARFAELRPAQIGPITDELNGVGSASVTLAAEHASALLIGGQVGTWNQADIELEITRQGARVFIGPIVAAEHTPGWLRVEAWTREAYLARAIVGDAERTNLLPQGYFDSSLTGWVEVNGANAAAVSSPVYRREWTMALAPNDGGQVRNVLVLPPVPRVNIVNIMVVARYTGGTGWMNLGSGRAVARIRHYVTTDVLNWPAKPRKTEIVTLPDDIGKDTWWAETVKVQEAPDYWNRYVIDIFTPDSGFGFIGEVEIVRSETTAARAGSDRAELIAALYKYLLKEVFPSRYSRAVGTTGVKLAENIRFDHSDHPDAVSILRQWEPYGDWWIGNGTTLRWAPRRGARVAELDCHWSQMDRPTVTKDAREASTHVVTIADGGYGPTREEASARTLSPYRLSFLHRAIRGLPPKELDDLARKMLTDEGPAQVQVSGQPRLGPLSGGVRTMPGQWWHLTQPGDSFRVRVEDAGGLVDFTVEPRIASRTLNPQEDTMEVRLTSARRG